MDRRLLSRIEGQNGLVTRGQALEGGMSVKAVRCKVESGRWVRLHPGVYLTAPGRDDWETRALAVLLHIGTPSALYGRSAAYLWGLVASPGRQIEVVVGAARNPDPVPGAVVHRSRHAFARTHETAWPHRTTVEHTVLDLADGQPLDVAVGPMAKALQLGLTSARNLRLALDERPSQTSRSLLLEVIGDVGGGVESSAERRYVRDVEHAHGLPVATRQAPAPRSGRRDNLYEQQRVVVEVDGRLGHSGWRAQQHDGRRDRRAAATGRLLTVRAYWPDVVDGRCELAADVGEILMSRGWAGRARPCRRPGCDVGRGW